MTEASALLSAGEASSRKRRQRPRFSCEDCRRLKLKCDRQVPCSNCVRRGYTQKCIDDSNLRDTGDANRPGFSRSQGANDTANRLPEEILEQQSGPGTRLPDLAGHSSRRTDNGAMSAALNLSESLDFEAPPAATSSSRGQQSASSPKLGHGTLVLGRGGTSKYLGPTAASEWLKDSETQDVGETAANSRAPSPCPEPTRGAQELENLEPVAFPFNASPAGIRTADLLSRLPPREEGQVLVECYYRYCSWHHDVVPRASFQSTFDKLYDPTSARRSNAQSIALVYIVLAQGTLFNLEMPNIDSSAEDWLHLSERALVKGNFLASNTIAGVQTLHLMAHYHLHVDKGNRGDSAWTLWGLCMRMIQAMGMHRDGARWNLSDDVLEERRKVFWECNAADVFQAHCFSRPCAINPNHCDTLYPGAIDGIVGDKGYTLIRFDLSRISAEVLENASNVREPDYTVITSLHDKLCRFEREMPYGLRCRAAVLATPSRYSDPAEAAMMAPEPSRRSMTTSFQQSSLALNVSETIVWLHRPYYAKALYAGSEDRQLSTYGPSYLAVIERCAVMIAIVSDIYARFPAVTARQWHFWYHTFNSAVCLGTLVLRDPRNILADFALTQITLATNLYGTLVQSSGPTPRVIRNLQWLVRLQTRATSKIASAKGQPGQNDLLSRSRSEGADSNEGDDVELLGWRTRLVERAIQNKPHARTVESPRTPLTENPPSAPDTAQFISSLLQTSGAIVPVTDLQLDTSTDVPLRDFWDPLVLQTSFGAPNSSDEPSNISNVEAFLNWWSTEGETGLF